MRRMVILLAVAAVAACGCGKKAAKPSDSAPAPSPSAPAPSAGVGNTNFVPGGGAVQNVRQAARRTVAIHDMRQLGIFIEQAYSEGAKMPGKKEIEAAIAREAPNIAKHVADGDIVLTGTADHAGLWAYEVEADTKGGLVLIAGVPDRAGADDAKKLIGK